MKVDTNQSMFKDVYIKGMDVDIHLLTKGNQNGIPLIFLPGITSYCNSFLDVLKRIPEEYYCLSVDLRGRGKSTWPSQGYLLKNYMDDLLYVVNYVISNPISPFLIGHSMGARIAAAFGSQFPKLLSGIVLVDPPIHGPGQREEYPTPLAAFLEQKKAVDEGVIKRFNSYFPHFNEAQLIQRAEEYRNVAKQAIIESYHSFKKEPLHVYIKSLSIPSLLLQAELGDTIRDEEAELIKRINPNMGTCKVKGSGHMIYKEKPDEFIHYTLDFVNDTLNL
ncbi:alpha/beta fold hydrolase [Brevibacillus massiliensis]|uniref:alpha/beta fold hydrolase n=1 Tax=Brevibacillus massiliensis TaxID=1118054 RepID=UPI000305CF58|nr:alpha/beta hydrolase [Brevibacillus massiliensis]